MESFEGKVGVVTGGGSGIGRAICLALAQAGANVVVADIDGDNAAKVAEEVGGKGARGCAVTTDVTQSASVAELADEAVKEMGGVDIVCNNAGVYLGGEMAETTEDDWRFVLSVNLDGVFRVGQRFAKLLREQGRGGHIVNTASIGGFLSHGAAVAYAASKFGVVAYSEALRADLEPEGIGVSTLCPGPIRTSLAGSDRLRAPGEQTGGKSQALWEYIREGMEPEEVGRLVLDGIRDNAAYIFTHDWSEAFADRFQRVLKDFERLR
ncbi:MAG: SDR family oxidoreductase [Deltaproteobacteria bacterium]|nr:SDR family oxidoreductase [Deltaproteobacteria bacterium]